MIELETERLLLRRWTTGDRDIDWLFDLYSRWEVQRYIGTSPRVSEHRSEAVERAERYAALEHAVHGIWAVETRGSSADATGDLLGVVLLKPLPASGTLPLEPSGEIEIGWHFHPDAWGRGFATEAASRVLAHAFDGGLTRVLAVTNPANVASQAVCLRIGMTDQGETDRFYNATCRLFVVERP